MRVSLSVTNYSWPDGPADVAGTLDQVVAAADRGGIDTVWVADHLLQAEPGTSVDEPMLEAYATLGYLAARTGRVRLGTAPRSADRTGTSRRPSTAVSTRRSRSRRSSSTAPNSRPSASTTSS